MGDFGDHYEGHNGVFRYNGVNIRPLGQFRVFLGKLGLFGFLDSIGFLGKPLRQVGGLNGQFRGHLWPFGLLGDNDCPLDHW